MGFHQRQWNHFQSRLMGCFKVEWACMAGVDCSKPCPCTNAPCITRFQPRETVLGRGRHQIIAATFGKFKKGLCNQTTHRMTAPIVLIGVAFSIPIPTGHRVTRTTVEGLAKDVRNLLFPYWGRDNRGVWPKGEYGTGPLGADHFCILDKAHGPGIQRNLV